MKKQDNNKKLRQSKPIVESTESESDTSADSIKDDTCDLEIVEKSEEEKVSKFSLKETKVVKALPSIKSPSVNKRVTSTTVTIRKSVT